MELGIQVHAHLIVCGVELCAFLGSQLLEVFWDFKKAFKCVKDGVLPDQVTWNSIITGKIKQKDLVSWNAMLAGYALGGFREEVTNLLDEMEFQGVEPDIVTWNG
ncbi:hypothetical protein WN943_009860 [Citrus x changshan-huyou]